ncbi:hypothetical protein EVAR_82253_1 [Eumeta japonica]|uniref:Uncharacterized protein n=1 Tax=Eumeta variegata TaxID=151549 RepID=A0A4C1VYD4_EUMVA|nr:hypothetical protein EVAR_82253_1 [Eumeta japonica]
MAARNIVRIHRLGPIDDSTPPHGNSQINIRKLRESKKTDLFYHLLRNVSLPFLNHAGAQHSELSASRRQIVEQLIPCVVR